VTETTTRIDRRLLLTAAGIGAAALVAPARAQSQGCDEDTLDRIRRTGVFNLGVRDAAPPYGFKDADGHYTGFATELALAIYGAVNRELGGKIELANIPVTSATRIALLQNATIDMEAGASVVTQGRAKVVGFVMPHFLTSTAVLVPADSPIKSLADMSGKRIGVPQGGLEEAAYRALNARKATSSPVRTIGFPDHPQGLTALETGTIDAYSSDEPILWSFATEPGKWRIVEININSFQQAFLIRPSSAKFRWLADVALANVFASGQWTALYDKYFGAGSKTPQPLNDQLKTLVLMNSWPA
jgi:glutamate/aspartate transport system substrate-binding protein